MTRIRYDRSNEPSAIAAAQKLAAADGLPRYVWATALGLTITKDRAPFRQQCWRVTADGYEFVPRKEIQS